MNMATIERFEDLEAWQRARELTNVIYDMSDVGAFARDFPLRDQIRRAAVYIMSNIARASKAAPRDFTSNTWEEQKPRAAKFVHNCIWHTIASMCQVRSSSRLVLWQKVSAD